MKMGRKNKDDALLSKPAVNKSNKTLTIMAILVITAGLILWVLSIGRKAESTVTVAMLNQPVYKNEAITTDMLKPYEMIEAEFEKYAIKNKNGEITRRVVLWDEVNTINGAFAAYSLQADTVLEYRSLVKSRVDNSDTVLYNFPGKDIVQLDIGTSDLNAFKTFLRPGDRLNIEAIYSDNITVEKPDDFGASVVEEEISVFKTTTVFGDIMVADLINANGDSILDIYEEYNQMTIYQQAQLDASTDFKSSVEPKSLLLALTEDEKLRYYEFLTKSNVTFRVSLPQRTK
jgi:hypothetical protein